MIQGNAEGKVHLVGSIGLETVRDTFATCGRVLGSRLRRLPDGELGGRRQWISWQLPLLRSMAFLELVNPEAGLIGQMRLAKGFAPNEVEFPELGYAHEARASYLALQEARQRGEVASGVRFQVSLPTAFETLSHIIHPDDLAVVEQAYSRALKREVDMILEYIPHDDLAIQWDICIEMVIWDGQSDFWRWPLGGDAKEEIIKRLKEAGEWIPRDVQLGYHLCYGDLDAKHFFNPKDAGAMVELSNRLAAAVDRPINWIHMPVPVDRDDDAYFKPLDDLRLDPETEIYLGLVHAADGVEGLRRRMAAADKHVQGYGVATECGMARARTPDLVRSLIKLHSEAPPAAAG